MHRATTTIRHIARREMLAAAAAALATAKDTAWKIGIAQISLSDRLEENQKKIVAYIRKAAAEQCRVVVFPEGSLCAEPAAEAPEIDRSLAEIRAAATAAKIYVLLGGKSIALGEKVSRNWMVAVEPAGKQILRYDKLYDNPRARAPGVFSMDGWGCSAIICADRWLRFRVGAGAGVVLVCSASNPKRSICRTGQHVWRRETRAQRGDRA
ncbi:MAG TPA: nitrilase-related carbon-nitrogen hydrolase [Bryobacteraceae bacterium]|nr:nitrilase-related carbon-nitrogen hydrolase [Bryobacteraceae bacterium]